MLINYVRGTFYSHNISSKDSIISLSEKLPISNGGITSHLLNNCKFAGCFDPFWNHYNHVYPFYFCFSFMPEWIEELVDEFNNAFENIKIELVHNSKVYGYIDTNTYGEPLLKLNRDKTDRSHLTFSVPVFRVLLRETYPINFRSSVTYIIHHYLRMFSYTEKFLHVDDKKPDSFLDFACLELNNSRRKREQFTRCISDKHIDKHDLLLMDNLKLTQYLAETRASMGKQTSILYNFRSADVAINSMAKNNVGKQISYAFRVGDYCKVKLDFSSTYRITNSDMHLGLVTAVNPGIINVKVLDHIDKKEVGGIYTVQSDRFFRVYSDGRKARIRIGDRIDGIVKLH